MPWRNPYLYALLFVSLAVPTAYYFWRQETLAHANQNAKFKPVEGMTARKFFEQNAKPAEPASDEKTDD